MRFTPFRPSNFRLLYKEKINYLSLKTPVLTYFSLGVSVPVLVCYPKIGIAVTSLDLQLNSFPKQPPNNHTPRRTFNRSQQTTSYETQSKQTTVFRDPIIADGVCRRLFVTSTNISGISGTPSPRASGHGRERKLKLLS